MSLLERLASAPSPRAYQKIVLDEVRAGHMLARWVPLSWLRGGHSITIDVLAVPLAIDDGSGPAYVMASATLQQLVADELGALLPTPVVLDEMWRQADICISADSSIEWERPWYRDNSLGTPAHMAEQSAAIAKAASMGPGIVGVPWKTWCLVRWLADGRLLEGSEQACNHGLYVHTGGDETPGGFRAIQVMGGRHGREEVDYSQVVLLMMGRCVVDGAPMATEDVLRSPELSVVLAHDGPLTVTRQPGVFDMHAFDPPRHP